MPESAAPDHANADHANPDHANPDHAKPDHGGEAACLRHVVDDIGADTSGALTIADLTAFAGTGFDASGPSGAVWSLPHGGDLDANLVTLHAGDSIGEHVNGEVDVLMVVIAGHGTVTVAGSTRALQPRGLAFIPKGLARAVHATEALTYLSIHRRRDGGLHITRR
ncbi:MAG TPA: hypothetical protein PLV68_19600 [Ilumatobacteraceae bacterium]|nr:hypothetical protein [Ilumatobacteraceae bacterium]